MLKKILYRHKYLCFVSNPFSPNTSPTFPPPTLPPPTPEPALHHEILAVADNLAKVCWSANPRVFALDSVTPAMLKEALMQLRKYRKVLLNSEKIKFLKQKLPDYQWVAKHSPRFQRNFNEG